MKNSAIALLILVLQSASDTRPGGPEEPVRVVSEGIDLDVHDGRLRPAVGVETVQVMRANRTHPEKGEGYGWTYNHAPMLSAANKSLELQDRDPYDYAKAVRVFAEAKSVRVALRLFAAQTGTGRLEIEVLDGAGRRPVRVVFGEEGRVQSANGSSWTEAGTYKSGVWCRIELAVDAAAGKYDLSLDGKSAVRGASFAEHSATVERLSFCTGAFRTEPTRQTDRYSGADLPAADDPVAAATYRVDDVSIK